MAHYHASVKSGPKGKGAEHAQYIGREGRFKVPRYGEIGEKESGNLPEWAQGKASTFFAAADEYERSNGSAYREFELALPVELSEGQRGALVREFVAEQLGEKHAYAWAIHEPQGANPHVHIMFSERTRDGIERSQELYFKRANLKAPERGGQLKSDRFSGGMLASERKAVLDEFRAQWANAQNRALERAGLEVRVDHRSLDAQGIDREAGQHRGPALSGIEARSREHVSEVGQRREAERAARQEDLEQERQNVVAQIRIVTREEVAAERVAVRERRELAQEVKGDDRQTVMAQVEADRREQIARVEAQAERRIERRQGIAGRLGEKLLEQARALRDRVVALGGRVREWVQGLWGPQERESEHGKSRSLAGEAIVQTPSAPPKREIDLERVLAAARRDNSRTVNKVHAEQRAAQERERLERERVREQERARSRGRGRGRGGPGHDRGDGGIER